MYLRTCRLRDGFKKDVSRYPYNIVALSNFDEMDFPGRVTFFVGENGSGKSTLLEGIANQCGFNSAGGSRNNLYNTHASESAFGDSLQLSWMPKVTSGFFLRSESFYQFASYIDSLEDPDKYTPYGGKSLHEQSHGESFLALFKNRFGYKGIYLLDEPEAALSPVRQLSLLRILKDLEKNSQFIIATHSPILLAYPGATIYSFDNGAIEPIDYESTSHYIVTKKFLSQREAMLRELFLDNLDELH